MKIIKLCYAREQAKKFLDMEKGYEAACRLPNPRHYREALVRQTCVLGESLQEVVDQINLAIINRWNEDHSVGDKVTVSSEEGKEIETKIANLWGERYSK